MERDEIRRDVAVRLACAMEQREFNRPQDLAKRAVESTDALLAALTPAPVAPPAGKYEPRVGHRLTFPSAPGAEYIITEIDGLGNASGKARNGDGEWGSWFGGSSSEIARHVETWRSATPKERAAVGIAAAGLAVPPPAPTPAPEGSTSDHPATNDYGQPVRVGASTGTTPAPEAKRPTVNVFDLSSVQARFPIGSCVRVVNAGSGDRAKAHPAGAHRTVRGYDVLDGAWRVLVNGNRGWVLDCEQIVPCVADPDAEEAKGYDVLAIKNAILRECPFDVRRKDLEDYHAMAIARAVLATLPQVKS